jgi:F-type H+-transporting ATPase subunit epsilon
MCFCSSFVIRHSSFGFWEKEMSDTPIIAAGSHVLQCVIVTPERAVLDEQADFVALPMFDGELGVSPGRSAMIGRLGIGEMRVKHGNSTKKYFIDSGFAQIRANVVTVLTAKALPATELKADAAQQALAATQATHPRTAAELDAKTKAQARARAQLRILGETTTAGHQPHG